MTKETELVPCAHCNAMVHKDHISKHIAKKHTFEASIARSRQAEQDEQQVECPHCKSMIKRKRLASHFRKVHGIDVTAKQLALKTEDSTAQAPSARRRKLKKPKVEQQVLESRFTSEREKNAFWKSIEAPEEEDESIDVFDKRRVVLGGAYGLGKNRRH